MSSGTFPSSSRVWKMEIMPFKFKFFLSSRSGYSFSYSTRYPMNFCCSANIVAYVNDKKRKIRGERKREKSLCAMSNVSGWGGESRTCWFKFKLFSYQINFIKTKIVRWRAAHPISPNSSLKESVSLKLSNMYRRNQPVQWYIREWKWRKNIQFIGEITFLPLLYIVIFHFLFLE